MPNCAILSCKNSTKNVGWNNGNISFHRFPNDPSIKEKWIDATGQKNWFRTKYITICSFHFNIGSFAETNKNRRLTADAIPTIDFIVGDFLGPVYTENSAKTTVYEDLKLVRDSFLGRDRRHSLSPLRLRLTPTLSHDACLDMRDAQSRRGQPGRGGATANNLVERPHVPQCLRR
ncbi:hypothetical protein ABMA28_003094 [Loxostege sticticalis]|uniref:THAP-type domain-containing protein n=1 Tax=Loxostege sticticalis TaxID=481309 RepID=A0ABD0SXK6_LOXSC